jgi:hypothetical protein
MKRLRRWMVRGVVALSVLLSIAVVALWFRSLSKYDLLVYISSSNVDGRYVRVFTSIVSDEGILIFARETDVPPDDLPLNRTEENLGWTYGSFGYPFTFPGFIHSLIGFRLHSDQMVDRWVGVRYSRYVGIPFWLALEVVCIPAQLILIRLYRDRRLRRRTADDRCQKCGYDLRATPDRCPECGTAKATGITISN